jgi:hypothetical protein
MTPNKTIRIIKSAERNAPPVNNKSEASDAGSAKQAGGGVTSQVASWVKEFQQRRRPDARRAFASLFGDTATPLNSLS